MVKCPRCEQLVDETARATCPLCFTPLAPTVSVPSSAQGMPPGGYAPPGQPAGIPQPMPGYAPAPPVTSMPGYGMQNAGQTPLPPNPQYPSQSPYPPAAPQPAPGMATRTTLSGEVIQTPMAAPMPPGASGGYGGLPPANLPVPGGYAPYAAPRPSAPPRSSYGSQGVATAVVILLVLAGGAFAFAYLKNRPSAAAAAAVQYSDPKQAALTALRSYLQADWYQFYGVISLPPVQRNVASSPDRFATMMENAVSGRADASSAFTFLKTHSTDFSVGDPHVTGDTADVPTTFKIVEGARSVAFHGVAHMMKEDGFWKLGKPGMGELEVGDLTVDLVGKPDYSSATGGSGIQIPGFGAGQRFQPPSFNPPSLPSSPGMGSHPGFGNPGFGSPGLRNPGFGSPNNGMGTPGFGGPPHFTPPTFTPPRFGPGGSGFGGPGSGHPGFGGPGMGNPGMRQPGSNGSGMGSPGMGNPGTGNPGGAVNPGDANGNAPGDPNANGTPESGSGPSGAPTGNPGGILL